MARQPGGSSIPRLGAWPWRRSRSGLTLALALFALAPVMAWSTAPVVALAAPATTAAGLLPSLPLQAPASTNSSCTLGLLGCGTSPTTSGPCVLGILLCGGNVVNQPAPCIAGLLCAPLAESPCVAGLVLCQGSILGPGNHPPGGGGSAAGQPGGGQSKGPGTTGTGSQGLPRTTGVASAFGLPPGVGLVPGPAAPDGGSAPNPDGFSELLSLSIRDGLAPGGSQLWPGLATLQAVLLLLIVGAFAARRVLEASKTRPG